MSLLSELRTKSSAEVRAGSISIGFGWAIVGFSAVVALLSDLSRVPQIAPMIIAIITPIIIFFY
jgi:hypothetical protein